MSATVWVVEEGEYSDYRVVGVFSSQAFAQQIADAINAPGEGKYYNGEATVAEWPLDPGIEELRHGLSLYFVVMQQDGTVDSCQKRGLNAYDLKDVGAFIWRRSTAPAYRNTKDLLHATVWATDETHAIKIANEHRTHLIASGEWAQT